MSHWPGEAPISSRKRRVNVRVLIGSWAARSRGEGAAPALIWGADRFGPAEGENAAKELRGRLLAIPVTEPIAHQA